MKLTELLPGWIPTSLIAGLLWFALQYLQVEFSGADWLPVALALILYIAKLLAVTPAPPTVNTRSLESESFDRPRWIRLLLW